MSNRTHGGVPGTNGGNAAGAVPGAYDTGSAPDNSGGGLYSGYGSGYGSGDGLGYAPLAPWLQPPAQYPPYRVYRPYGVHIPYIPGSYYSSPSIFQPLQFARSPYARGAGLPADTGAGAGAGDVPDSPASQADIRKPAEPHAGGPERPEERPPHVEHIDWAARYPGQIVLRGPERKAVALTFDDGPDNEWTPMVLDQLAQLNVKATFFVVGRRAQRFPNVLRRILREGHVIGNHSWDHPNLTRLKAQEIRSQIERTDTVIRKLTGRTPALLRPPYGALNETVVQEAIRLKKKIILWDVDSLDWMQLNGRVVAVNILAHAHPGAIIVMQSAGGAGEILQGTIAALPIVVDALRGRGYSFRTVPQLAGIAAYQSA